LKYLICFLGLLLPFTAFAQSTPRYHENVRDYLTDEHMKRLEAGETLTFMERKEKDGRDSAWGVTMVLVNRPRKVVWQYLKNQGKHPEFMPRMKKAEEYMHEDNKLGMHMTLKIFFKKVEYWIIQTFDEENCTFSWTLDKSKKNDVEATDGSWHVIAHGDNQCIALYRLSVDSGLFFPDFIENYLMKKDLPDVVHALKKRAETNGEYTK
jgi:hypothetical protein